MDLGCAVSMGGANLTFSEKNLSLCLGGPEGATGLSKVWFLRTRSTGNTGLLQHTLSKLLYSAGQQPLQSCWSLRARSRLKGWKGDI